MSISIIGDNITFASNLLSFVLALLVLVRGLYQATVCIVLFYSSASLRVMNVDFVTSPFAGFHSCQILFSKHFHHISATAQITYI